MIRYKVTKVIEISVETEADDVLDAIRSVTEYTDALENEGETTEKFIVTEI